MHWCNTVNGKRAFRIAPPYVSPNHSRRATLYTLQVAHQTNICSQPTGEIQVYAGGDQWTAHGTPSPPSHGCPYSSYLAFSVPRPPVLRVLALALAFLLPSVGKFAQQRLRGSCRKRGGERERGHNHIRRTASCDPSESQGAL